MHFGGSRQFCYSYTDELRLVPLLHTHGANTRFYSATSRYLHWETSIMELARYSREGLMIVPIPSVIQFTNHCG